LIDRFPLLRKASIGFLLLLALPFLIIFCERLRTYNEPLDMDTAIYAVMGHEMGQGRPLYSELFDQKPPGIYGTFALFELLAGYGPFAIFLLNLTLSFLLLLGFYWAASAGDYGQRAGILALFLWALLSGDLPLQANQPNTEAFLNLFLVWAFALWIREENPGRLRIFAIGMLFSLASFFKPIGLIPLFFLSGAYLGLRWVTHPSTFNKSLAQVGYLFLIVAGFWLCVLGYFFTVGRLRDFWWMVVDFNRFYVLIQSPLFPAGVGIFMAPVASRIWGSLRGHFPKRISKKKLDLLVFPQSFFLCHGGGPGFLFSPLFSIDIPSLDFRDLLGDGGPGEKNVRKGMGKDEAPSRTDDPGPFRDL
jgi:hypothetical protein